jgi:hypothetical protein
MPRKQTSAKVASIAGKYAGDANPFDDYSEAVADAIRAAGVPLSDRGVLVVQAKLEAALAPIVDDLRTLAASALGQREAKSQGFSVPPAE